MSNKKVKGCDVLKRGTVLIAITVMMALLVGLLGCSGGPKQDPTDPVGSKPADKGTETERTSGIGPSPYPDGTTPSERYGREGNIMEGLIDMGGGQGGDLLQTTLLAGVFDALTLEPIEDAYVTVGSDAAVYDQTDVVGCIRFTDFQPHAGFDPIGVQGIFVTAGAEGYELKSYSNVTRSVIALLLEPMELPTPAQATVHGTIGFNTEEFAGEVYLTNETGNFNRHLTPASPGDTHANFEISVLADIPGIFVSVWRDSETDEILRVFHETIQPIAEGGSYEILPVEMQYTDPDTEETDVMYAHNWVEWAPSARDYTCVIDLADGLEPDTIYPYFSYFSNIQFFGASAAQSVGSIIMNDKIEWQEFEFAEGEDYTELTAFNSSVVPNYSQLIPFENIGVMVDVKYDDGSGSIALVDYGRLVNPQNSVQLRTPPELTNSPIGLTPTLEWSLDSQDVFYPTKINMLDVSNDTRWIVVTSPGIMEISLPALPSEMAGWGLSEGDKVMFRLTVEIAGEETVTSADGTVTTIGGSNGITPVNYSRLNSFIP